MNPQNIIALVNQIVEEHRSEIGERPKTTPVTWKGISMTTAEAKLAIQKLEEAKLGYQKAMNSTQAGGEITKLATSGAGIGAMVVGAALMLFPPTALAGAITLASGAGAAGVGKVVGDGVREIGTMSNEQAVQQIDTYIDSIKNAIISSIP